MILKIGTRGSKLAVAQSEWVRDRVEAQYPDVRVELVRIKTRGDRILDSPLSEVGGKGLFVKEIEDALLKKEVDVAVHSMKDVPTELPERLFMAVFPERKDPRDALISIENRALSDLPEGALIGTSSLRRSAQLLHMRPDLNIVSLRGNVDTRLRKLESGDLQAVILAAAGLGRLGLSNRISHLLSTQQLLPAVGQGTLGLECRRGDPGVLKYFKFLNHKPTEVTVRAERALLKELEGGCQVPIAAFASLKGDTLVLQGLVAELDGSMIIKDEMNGSGEGPEDLGISLARNLLESGARQILSRIYGKKDGI